MKKGARLRRSDIPHWLRVDLAGRIWNSRKPGGSPSATERRAEFKSGTYPSVMCLNGVQSAHRVVYAWVHGEVPAGVLVRHLNDNRLDNRPGNLAIGTYADNAADAIRNGTFTRGSRHGMSKIDERGVRAIRDAYAGGETLASLASRYGICKSNVSFIVNRTTWAHVA